MTTPNDQEAAEHDRYMEVGTRVGQRAHSHGSPVCQDAAGSGVLGLVVDGLGCGLSEELVWGCEPAALE